MKRADLITILIVAAVICGFAFIPGAWAWFNTTTANHGLLMSFFKFALLGTFGEMLALRIREGVYMKKGFGLLPKLLIWGILGVVIASAMVLRDEVIDCHFHRSYRLATACAESTCLFQNKALCVGFPLLPAPHNLYPQSAFSGPSTPDS